MQTRLEKFWRNRVDFHPSSDSDPCDDYALEEKTQTEQWTRVATIEEMAKPKVRTFNLQADMKRGYDYSSLRFNLHSEADLMIFDPQSYKGKEILLTIDKQQLQPDQLLAFGRLATKLRLQLNNAAIKQVTNNPDIIENLDQQYD